MSYSYCTIAVRAPRADVLAATARYFSARGGGLAESVPLPGRRYDSTFFAVGEHDGFTVFGFGGPGVPALLARELSRELATEVVEVDQVESAGYAHFVWLDRGELRELCTIGIKPEELEVEMSRYVAAAEQFGYTGLADGDDTGGVYTLFVTVAGPLPIEELALDLIDHAGPGYRYSCADREAEILGSEANATWRGLMATRP